MLIMTRMPKTDKGLIKLIVVIVIALLLVAFLGLNLRSIINSPTFQDNWQLIKGIVLQIWTRFLKVPVLFIWNQGFIRFIWHPIFQNLLHVNLGSAGAPDSSSGGLLTATSTH